MYAVTFIPKNIITTPPDNYAAFLFRKAFNNLCLCKAISREFGSGGHSIGKIVAETLGIRFYDQELLEKIAEETGFSKEFIEEAAEYSVPLLYRHILKMNNLIF